MTTNLELIEKAAELAKVRRINKEVRLGDVGCALLTRKGNIYTGISIHACCGVGTCAEHGAICAMTANGEQSIEKIVAVADEGNILPPCGRCRELMLQINSENLDTMVIIEKNKSMKLRELLPFPWQDKSEKF